jgi:hypothetical protein
MPNITDEELVRLIESVENVQRELTNAIRGLNEDQRGSAQDALGAATRQVVTLKAVLQTYQLREKPPGSTASINPPGSGPADWAAPTQDETPPPKIP